MISLNLLNINPLKEELKENCNSPVSLNFDHLLKRMKSEDQITEKLRQIRVLNQMADETQSGFENCGLHALKNACIAIACCGDENATEIYKLFEDKSFFSKFYDAFCSSIMSRFSKGKADVTIPVLREIIQKVQTTEVSDPELKKVQQHFIKNGDQGLSLYSVVNIAGKCTLTIFEKKQLFDVISLCKQIQSKEPFVHTFLIGNQEFGHWYTLILNHKEAHVHEYLACDSINNFHSSELAPVVESFESELENPKQLLLKAFRQDADLIEKMASIIGTSSEKDLLDTTPVALLAEKDVHDGSYKSRLIDLCLQRVEAFQQADLFTTDRLELQIQLNQLKKILKFLISNVKDTDKNYSKLCTAYQIIEKNQPTECIDSIFKEGFKDLQEYKGKLTSHQLQNAQWTFENLQALYHEIPQIAQEIDPLKRLNLINKKLGTGSAEQGFSTGTSPEEIYEVLIAKVNLLLLTYQRAKEDHDLHNFFKCFSIGDSCLNNRMENLAKYSSKLLGIGEINDMVDWEKVYDLPACAIARLIEENIGNTDSGITEGNYRKLNPEAFKNPFLLTELVKSVELFQSHKNASEFIKFITDEGLLEKGKEPNWKVLMPSIIDHPSFRSILARAIAMVI